MNQSAVAEFNFNIHSTLNSQIIYENNIKKESYVKKERRNFGQTGLTAAKTS